MICQGHAGNEQTFGRVWWAEAGRNNALPLNFSPLATLEAGLLFSVPASRAGARILFIDKALFAFRKEPRRR